MADSEYKHVGWRAKHGVVSRRRVLMDPVASHFVCVHRGAQSGHAPTTADPSEREPAALFIIQHRRRRKTQELFQILADIVRANG